MKENLKKLIQAVLAISAVIAACAAVFIAIKKLIAYIRDSRADQDDIDLDFFQEEEGAEEEPVSETAAETTEAAEASEEEDTEEEEAEEEERGNFLNYFTKEFWEKRHYLNLPKR